MSVQESSDSQTALRAAYTEVCQSYERIDDFRAKLLGFLPLASGTGLFLLLERGGANVEGRGSAYPLVAAGIFGFVVTVGLLFYELRGIQRCIRLATVGRAFEQQLGVEGRFRRWPHSLRRVINEPVASALVYSGVLAGWAFLALFSIELALAVVSAIIVFVVGLVAVWRFYRYITEREEHDREESEAVRVFAVFYEPSGRFLLGKKLGGGYFVSNSSKRQGSIVPKGQPLEGGDNYALPGGTREGFEPIIAAAQRAFKEKTGEAPSLPTQNEWHRFSSQYAAGYFRGRPEDFDKAAKRIMVDHLPAGIEAKDAVANGTIKKYVQIRKLYPSAPMDNELATAYVWNVKDANDWAKISTWQNDPTLRWYYEILLYLNMNLLQPHAQTGGRESAKRQRPRRRLQALVAGMTMIRNRPLDHAQAAVPERADWEEQKAGVKPELSGSAPREPDKDTLAVTTQRYATICSSIKATDEISFKLLGLVPLVSGVGIFALVSAAKEPLSSAGVALFAMFAALITFSLYRWELRNISICEWFRDRIADIERDEFGLISGQYLSLPPAPRLTVFGRDVRIGTWSAGRIGKRKAEALLYGATMAAWIALACYGAVKASLGLLQ